MRGVLVDEPDGFVLVLADDVGIEHLARDAPRRGGEGREACLFGFRFFLLRRRYGRGLRHGFARTLRRFGDRRRGEGTLFFLVHRQRHGFARGVFHSFDRSLHRLCRLRGSGHFMPHKI